MVGKRSVKRCTEKDSIPFNQVEYDRDVFSVDHDGYYLIIDDFIESIRDLLPGGGYSHVKYIDQLDEIVTRYTIKLNKI